MNGIVEYAESIYDEFIEKTIAYEKSCKQIKQNQQIMSLDNQKRLDRLSCTLVTLLTCKVHHQTYIYDLALLLSMNVLSQSAQDESTSPESPIKKKELEEDYEPPLDNEQEMYLLEPNSLLQNSPTQLPEKVI